MYCASHGQQPKELIEDKFLTTISRICTKGLAGGKKAPVAQTGLCSYLKKNVLTKVFFKPENDFCFCNILLHCCSRCYSLPRR